MIFRLHTNFGKNVSLINLYSCVDCIRLLLLVDDIFRSIKFRLRLCVYFRSLGDSTDFWGFVFSDLRFSAILVCE